MGVLYLLYKLYIAVIFVITAILFYPILGILMLFNRRNRRTFPVFVMWSKVFRYSTFLFLRIQGEKSVFERPVIIVSNHASYLDIFLMHSVFPKQQFLFMGKSEILSYPLIRRYFKGLHIPVFRSNQVKAARSFIQAKQAIRENWSVVIFPEGTIPDEQNPKMIPFKEGAFRLAKGSKVGIQPITYINNHRLFSDPTQFWGSAHPGVSKVIIHPFISEDEVGSLDVEVLSAKCHQIIEAPLRKHYPKLYEV